MGAGAVKSMGVPATGATSPVGICQKIVHQQMVRRLLLYSLCIQRRRGCDEIRSCASPTDPIHTRSSRRVPSLCRMRVSLPTTRLPKNAKPTRGGARGALYRTSVLSTGKYHGADSVNTCTPKQWCNTSNARDSDGHNGEGSDWHLAVVEMPRTWSLMSLFKSPERFQSAEERAAKGRGDPATADG
jgi:hypothetical protein